MRIDEIFAQAAMMKASDIHVTIGVPIMVRIHGKLQPYDDNTMNYENCMDLVKQLVSQEQFETLMENHQIDFAYSIPGLNRFRINIFKQRNTYAIVARILNNKIPLLDELGLPNIIKELGHRKRGLILVTGPTGSGKSTTLASLIDYINRSKKEHIITLEDPIEYLHRHNASIINQRELGTDISSFASGLKGALRQDPDIILIGEMRDPETISIASTAAETGHLVMSTLHTVGAVKTIDRIIDSYPPHQQPQIRSQMATIIEGVISQQLIPTLHGDGRVVALEIMVATPAIRSMIREGKTHQMNTVIQTSSRMGMRTMDQSLADLYRQGKISKEMAITYAVDKENIEKSLIY